MRDRIHIRKTGPKRWTVRIPTVGFGPAETVHKPSHQLAVKYADQRIPRESSNIAHVESNWQPTDGVNVVPGWTPLQPGVPYLPE